MSDAINGGSIMKSPLSKSALSTVGLGITLALSTVVHAASNLGSYNVNPDTVTVAGLSSGASLAVQLQVAYSKSIFGTAIFAGSPYHCGKNALLIATACQEGIGISVPSLVSYTESSANAGDIDPTANIAGKPIYMFSGTKDIVVSQKSVDALYQYLQNFTSAENITYNNNTPAQHSWISPDAAHSCSHLGAPWLNNCGIDPEQEFLGLFYGSLNARNNGTLGGSYIEFNQDRFCPKGNCKAIDMDSTAWAFVPQSCADGAACRLVVALHGCEQGQYLRSVGTDFVKESGINEWADTNNIVVLYPQAIATVFPLNGLGCWDWWGYTGSNYAIKGAPQMTTIMAEVNQVTGGR
jgi:poly(3-hydroxybutyrate) depolymerase